MLMQCIFAVNNRYLLDSGVHIYLDTLLEREILTYLFFKKEIQLVPYVFSNKSTIPK